MKNEPLKIRIAWWIAFKLPPLVLLYAVVRAFSFFGDSGNHDYSEVYNMIKKKYNLKDV